MTKFRAVEGVCGVRKLTKATLLLAAATYCGLAGGEVSAQTVGQSQGEIVVTAQKREASAQDTPIALSVVSGEQLRAAGVTDMQSLAQISPNVSFAQADGFPIITIRGISSRDVTEVGDPAIAVSRDGFYENRPYSLTASFYDIERVEVLRGPQGTLYGRNATGGAINVLSARPTSDASGYVTAGFGNYNAYHVEGAVNTPIFEGLNARISYGVDGHDGYRDTPPNGKGDSASSRSIRGQLSYEPTSRLKLWGLLEYSDIGGRPGVALNIPYVYDENGAVIHDRPSGIQSNTLPASIPTYNDVSYFGSRWSADYDAGAIQLHYLGGYARTNFSRGDDYSSVDDSKRWTVHQIPKTLNQEFRVSSASSSPVFWQVGAFYFSESNSTNSGYDYPQADGSYNRGFGFDYTTNSKSYAFFGQATVPLTSQLKLTGGIRYSHDKKSRNGDILVPATDVNVLPITYTAYPQLESASWQKVTWSADLDYQVTRHNLLYAKVSTGYKAGGFTDLNSYDPETVTSYEIGSKNEFLNGLVQLNISGHYDDYANQQVTQIVGSDLGGGTMILNAGKSEIYGIETDLTVRPTPSTRIGASVNWLHARFTDFAAALDGVNVQLAGNQLPNAPDWTVGLNADQDIHIGSSTLTAHVDGKFTSSQYFSYTNYQDVRQGSYFLGNARLTYSREGSPWQVSVYVNNITDKAYFINAEENSYSNNYRYTFSAPRTFGGRVTVKW